MKKIVFILNAVFVLFVGCFNGSNNVKNKEFVNLNEEVLDRLGISTAQTPPKYGFEEFFKTRKINNFQFASDASKVFFLKDDGKYKNIFEYDVSQSKISQVTGFADNIVSFLVDPQARFLIVAKDIDGNELYDLYSFNLKTKEVTPLTDGHRLERSILCSISNDGNQIYFSQSRDKMNVFDIKVIDLNKNTTKTILQANHDLFYCDSLNESNDRLGFTRFVTNNEIHLGYIDLKTGQHQYILSETGVKNTHSQFVHDDIYFLSTKDSDHLRIWKYNTKDGLLSLVDTPVNQGIDSFDIFDNGKISVIKFRGEFSSQTKIYDGVFVTEKEINVGKSELVDATFYEHGFNFGVVELRDGSAPTKYYLIKEGRQELFYNQNQSSIADQDFSKVFSLFIQSFDGLNIPTHFFIPNGTSHNNKKPVILWIHGGPESHKDPEYDSTMQFFVNQGYIVVVPNVRGSSGFGKAYQFKDNGDWGGGHIKDIVAVTEYAKNLDFSDKNNFFIMGGSFGGFSVLSLITQYPKIFNAAVDIFGPVNMSSFLDGMSNAMQKYFMEELGFDPKVDLEKTKRISPIFHVDKIQIPLQVHQGANDIRVPKTESDQVVEELKKLGKPVEYFVYEDEGHGFDKFENSQACYTRILDFFNKNIKK